MDVQPSALGTCGGDDADVAAAVVERHDAFEGLFEKEALFGAESCAGSDDEPRLVPALARIPQTFCERYQGGGDAVDDFRLLLVQLFEAIAKCRIVRVSCAAIHAAEQRFFIKTPGPGGVLLNVAFLA